MPVIAWLILAINLTDWIHLVPRGENSYFGPSVGFVFETILNSLKGLSFRELCQLTFANCSTTKINPLPLSDAVRKQKHLF